MEIMEILKIPEAHKVVCDHRTFVFLKLDLSHKLKSREHSPIIFFYLIRCIVKSVPRSKPDFK
jgi:hypothetical protein